MKGWWGIIGWCLIILKVYFIYSWKGDNAILEEKKTEKVVVLFLKGVVVVGFIKFYGTRLLEFDIIKRIYIRESCKFEKKDVYDSGKKKRK